MDMESTYIMMGQDMFSDIIRLTSQIKVDDHDDIDSLPDISLGWTKFKIIIY